MTRIFLMRHGQSQHNAAFENGGSYQSVDELGSSLTDLGKQQAENVARELRDVYFHVVYSSDYHRARQTAEIVVAGRNLDHHQLPSLRERQWGSLTGRNFGPVIEQIRALQHGRSDEEKMHVKIVDDMESEWEAGERLSNVLQKLAQIHKDQTILVVNHGNIMRSFLTQIGFGTYAELGTGAVSNCGYAMLAQEPDGRWAIEHTSGILKQHNDGE